MQREVGDLNFGWLFYFLIGSAVVAATVVAADGVVEMVSAWQSDEYSHSYLIPFISIWLFVRRLPSSPPVDYPVWTGVALLVMALGGVLLGELSALYIIVQYSYLAILMSVAVVVFGRRAFSVYWVAFAYLFFMIPLPGFFLNNLSNALQLISSEIGVYIIRLFNISVFLQGNVIDLGSMQLQVADACSGLRYLFPLSSFGFLVAYLFQVPLWQRAILFVSTIPITVLMNSFRIGVIGVLVEYWGKSQAEGFLHYFEGWIIFTACLAVLLGEMWLMHKFSGMSGSVIDRIDLKFPERKQFQRLQGSANRNVGQLLCLLVCVVATTAMALTVGGLSDRKEAIPQRSPFLQFPLFNQQWIGRESYIAADVLTALKLTDNLMADYTHPNHMLPVNLHIAYYDSQRKGSSVHSPRSCIPGGGWEIQSIEQVSLDTSSAQTSIAGDLSVNRVVIQQGSYKQLVYYWFKQRSRNLTNEYLVKWYLLIDSLTQNRTDGAMVRVTVPVPENYAIDIVDRQIVSFIQDFYPILPRYLPD